MTVKSKILFVLLEFVSGLGLAVLAVYICSLFDRSDLLGSIILGMSFGFVGMVSGISFVGYFQLKKLKKIELIGRQVILSVIGLFLFTLLYVFLESLTFYISKHNLSSTVLPVFLPSVGAVLGFNLKILKTKY